MTKVSDILDEKMSDAITIFKDEIKVQENPGSKLAETMKTISEAGIKKASERVDLRKSRDGRINPGKKNGRLKESRYQPKNLSEEDQKTLSELNDRIKETAATFNEELGLEKGDHGYLEPGGVWAMVHTFGEQILVDISLTDSITRGNHLAAIGLANSKNVRWGVRDEFYTKSRVDGFDKVTSYLAAIVVSRRLKKNEK